LHGDDVEWPLDIRALMVLPEEQGKGFCVEGVEVDLGLDPVFLFSRLDIIAPDTVDVMGVEPALKWFRSRIREMDEPAIIVVRDNWIIRYMLRDQRRIESELDAHIKAALEVLSSAAQAGHLLGDRIVPVSDTEVSDDRPEGEEATT
jgi:hypothetical protein